ncbi:chorismate--pyruvate lyase family protein [Marinomonas ostreistagni]|uniref:Probable chorismate pyruvate-lyase n=1 Tax=Marinomonas ostreistagni TaxID=359209 RepID=A0ABS0ZC08_9GAMM|nr:chorismate lyase [Marinomonas ostreistagni]MBJ7551203.1 chorismate lyase [Marinomonas ostreistagni]
MNLLDFKKIKQLDYQWHSINQVRRTSIPKDILPWLITRFSITAKLRQAGQLRVDVLEDSWQTPTPREQLRLRLKSRETARVRTVVLYLDNEPMLYARSIIPARSMKGSWRFLPYLGNQPLGGYVYKSRALRRSTTEVVKLPAGLIQNSNEALWARRSVFIEYGPGILVNEAFYPAISRATKMAGQL